MSDEHAPVPIADGTVRRLFDEPEFRLAKRGYDPDDVVAFLDDLGGRTMKLISRLRGAEKTAKAAQTELDGFRHRAEQAESSRELFDRTLALAEETANASVADAKSRAARIDTEAQRDARRMIDETRLRVERMMDAARVDVHRAHADERQALADDRTRIQSESDQLETLRLAVAAETMALEEVRNELRRRIRRVATDLLGVAESPDCLGTPVTRGIPEVVADRSPARSDQEDTVPSGDGPPAVAGAESETAAIAASGTIPPDGVRSSPQPEVAGEATRPDEAIDLSEPGRDEPGEAGPDPADDDAPSAPSREDAFDRFMSSEIEEEPSRTWILA